MKELLKSSPHSPCIRRCCLDSENICVGCFRSLDEILDWHHVDDAMKRKILLRCENRKNDRASYHDSWESDKS